MGCPAFKPPKQQVEEMMEMMKLLVDFAVAQEAWEGMVLCDDGHWFDDMPEEFLAKFEEVQALRNQSLKAAIRFTKQEAADAGPGV